MSSTTRIERSDTGGLLIVKGAAGEADVERLHREARMLALARHPGVVELCAFRDLGGPPGDGAPRAELLLTHAGAHSLATLPLRSVSHATGLVAALAETVADLHSIGIVHHRIDAGHVLIDAEGRPVLGGFAGATLVGEPADPDDGASAPARPADDLPGLGTLLRALTGSGTEPDPIPDRRLGRRTKSRAYACRALLNLADQATVDDPSLRPSARSFATAIRAVEPDAVFVPPALLAAGRSRIEAPVVADPATTDDLDDEPTALPVRVPAGEPRGRPDGPGSTRLPPRPSTRSEQAARRSARAAESVRSATPTGESAPPPRPRVSAAGRGRRGSRRASPARGLPAAAAMAGIAAITFAVLSTWHGERPNLAEASPPRASDLPAQIAALDASSTSSASTTIAAITVRPDAPSADAPSAEQASTSSSSSTTGRPAAPPASGGGPGPAVPSGPAACATVTAPADPAATAGVCARSVALADGVLQSGGHRYAVGEPNDEVLVGDWLCNGTPVPALVRPGTGETFVFTAWATPGADVHAQTLDAQPPGSHLESASTLDPKGCPLLVSRTATGNARPVPTGPNTRQP